MTHAAGHVFEWATLAGVTVNNPEGYIAGLGTLALVNAGLAQSKNRTGLGWFLLSLVLGPFATFILVAFCARLPEPSEPREGG